MKNSHLLTYLFFAICTVGIASPPRPAFRGFATDLTLVALRDGNGTIADTNLLKIAAKLLEYLEGQPAEQERLYVRIDRLENSDPNNEIVVHAGYDRGIGTRGYTFVFQKKSYALVKIYLRLSE